jgi:hypothetical protein
MLVALNDRKLNSLLSFFRTPYQSRCGTLRHLSQDMNWSERADFFKQVCLLI